MKRDERTKVFFTSIFVLLATLVIFLGIFSLTGKITDQIIKGDLNSDKVIDQKDLDLLQDYLYEGGETPDPIESADVTLNGKVNYVDLNYIERYLYDEGPKPLDPEKEVKLTRGDVNRDGQINQEDITFLTDYIYNSGDAPYPQELGNVNADDKIDNKDVSYLAAYVNMGGPAPVSLDFVLTTLLRGDLNSDGQVTQDDVTLLSEYIYMGAAAPDPLELADINADNKINLADMNYLIAYVNSGGPAPVAFEENSPIRGDLNSDGYVGDLDLEFLVSYIYENGPAPNPKEIADINSNGKINLADVNYLVNYLYNDGPAPIELEKEIIPTRGDVNRDGQINQEDITLLSEYIYYGVEVYPRELANVNADNKINLADMNYLIAYVNSGGPAPVSLDFVSTKLIRGDLNSDGYVGDLDLEFLVSYIYENGPAPNPKEIADINSNGKINLADVNYLVNYLYNDGPAPIEFTGLACYDSDGGLNTETFGSVTGKNSEGQETTLSDECIIEGEKIGWLKELTCEGDTITETEYDCSADDKVCVQGVCVEEGPGSGPSGGETPANVYCESLVEGGPMIQGKTRVEMQGKLKYCDPSTLSYKETKELGKLCLGDYECISNVCIDGVCTSIREELERQGNLLEKIWCAITNPLDVFKRDSAGEDETNNNYLACINN